MCGIESKIISMVSVMGLSSAQAILRRVEEDLLDSSGVYAIVDLLFLPYTDIFRQNLQDGAYLIFL